MAENDDTHEHTSDPNTEIPRLNPDEPLEPESSDPPDEAVDDTTSDYSDVNSTESIDDCTPLYEFLEKQTDDSYDADKLSKLLANKKDINTPSENDYKRTPLHIAIFNKLTDAVKQLILAGASVSVPDEDGRHPLHYACQAESPEIVELLLKQDGIQLEATDCERSTPLITASLGYSAEIIQLLVNAGANTQATNEYGSSPLYYASRYREIDFAKIILKKDKDSVDITNGDGLTPLHAAVVGGYEDMVRYLLDERADFNIPDKNKRTPVWTAVDRDLPNIVGILADHTAEINVPCNDGLTPLMVAAKNGLEDSVGILLDHGADPNVKSGVKWTALMYACDKHPGNVLEKLLGLDNLTCINDQDEDGKTSLHIASSQGHAKAVASLLKANAHINTTDNEGRTALHYASETHEWYLLDLYDTEYEQIGQDTSLDIENIPSASGQYCMTLDILLRQGANFRAQTIHGDTALHLAVKQGDPRRVQVISNTNMQNFQEYTTIQNKKGRTALYVAFESYTESEKYRLDTMRLLLHKMRCADFGEHSEHDEQEVIIWAAESEHTHDIAKSLFAKSKATVDRDKPHRSESWSVIEWATYREMPKAVWVLLSSSPLTPQTNENRLKALDYANSQVSKMAGRKSEPRQTRDGGKNKGKKADDQKQEDTRPDDITLIRDILLDSLFTQTSRPEEPFMKPIIEGTLAATVQGFEAAIIDFYESESKSGFLRRFRNVKEVIYDKGPRHILKDAKTNLGKALGFQSSGYSKPSNDALALHEMYIKDNPKFTWVHLPATNMVWMNDLLRRIMWDAAGDNHEEEKKKEFNEMNSFFRDSWLQVPNTTSPSRFMKPQCVSDKNNIHRAIYIPYLTLSRNFSRVPEKAKKKHKTLFDAYKDKVIHGFPTLDESYYHFTKDESAQEDRTHRNETQVITKALRRHKGNPSEWPLLRVNQLWIWVINDNNLITSTTYPVHKEDHSLLTDIFGYLSKKTEVGGSLSQPSTAAEMSKMLVDFCVDFYEQIETDLNGQSTRQIYFNAINEIAMKETILYEKFNREKNKINGDTSDNPDSETRGKGKAKPEDKEDKRELASVEIVSKALSEAARLSCEIKDIRDELNILKTIAQYQHTVQVQLDNVPAKSDSSKATTSLYSDYSAARIVHDILAMDKAADRIHSAVDTILALEQNETANKLADESVKQGQTLMTFTIITVLFLPLSFLSSIFALDYENSRQTPGKVYAIIVLVAFGVFLLIVAFGLKQDQSKRAGQWLLGWLPKPNSNLLSFKWDVNLTWKLLFWFGETKAGQRIFKSDEGGHRQGGEPRSNTGEVPLRSVTSE
ncbi:uncharacterized protein F4807DRAFT_444149 [Annulohypoxylon truncatum]|uniref:uncharacterized protein n=1 Tax=Annulohypoxylon truncatum TaxID=327061 RepID=UPI002008081C|nr:uncharacterized protein F4807DRAFT_444149 [Annulohypoxylon truncatum]KAI1205140.1 hypothetical protein F4807DRAFT_444149 [Annulohypoxylon truncatum]